MKSSGRCPLSRRRSDVPSTWGSDFQTLSMSNDVGVSNIPPLSDTLPVSRASPGLPPRIIAYVFSATNSNSWRILTTAQPNGSQRLYDLI